MTVGRPGRRDIDHDDGGASPYPPWAAGSHAESGASEWDQDWRRLDERYSVLDDHQTGRSWSPRWQPDAAGRDGAESWESPPEAGWAWERPDPSDYHPRHDAAGRWETGSYSTVGPYPPADDRGWRSEPLRRATGAHRRVDPRGEPVGVAPEGDGEGTAASGKRQRRKGLPLWQELPLLLVIAFCLAVLIRTFLMQAFIIPSGSMEDTLVTGDRVLVNKLVYHFREPARGEIVVFRGTDAWAPADAEDDVGALTRIGRTLGDLVGISHPGKKDYIKRIVGLPGDRVACCDDQGRVLVNGQPLDEPYVLRDSPLDVPPAYNCQARQFDEVVVAPGNMFVMGDHRLVSQDSRCQGQVPIENIIGRAFVIVWPSDRWASLSAPETFAGLEGPGDAAAVAPITEPVGQPSIPLVLAPIPLTLAALTARSQRSAPMRTRRLSA